MAGSGSDSHPPPAPEPRARPATARAPGPSVIDGARRILVYGVTGSGKTTLARRIGELTGLPWHAMDDEVGWLPGWVERPVEEQRRLVVDLVAEEAWVLDTAYGHWRDLVLARTDLVVGLDYPRWRSLSRLAWRTLRRAVTREEVCNGNTETLLKVVSRDSIVVWNFRSFARKRSLIASWDADERAPTVVRLRTPREADRWLAALHVDGERGVSAPSRHPA